MSSRFRPFHGLCAFVVLSAALAAQTLSVPNGVLTPGDTITIGYSNPALAGQKVTVKIDDGGVPSPQTSTVEIMLDASGNGTAPWTVPVWELARFNAPGAPEQTRAIEDPEAPDQRSALLRRPTNSR